MSKGSSKQEPAPKPKSLGLPLWIIFKTIAIFFASQLVAVLVVRTFYEVVKHSPNADLNNSIWAQFFYILLAEGLVAAMAIWLVRRRGLGLGSIGLGRRPQFDDVLKGLLGFGAAFLIIIIVGIIISGISPDINDQKQNLGFNNLDSGTDNLLAFVALVILPPIGEEILTRGYLFSGLRKTWRFWPALLATSFLFAVPHLEFGSGTPLVWAAAIDTFLLSIILCFLRERTGALYAGMLTHMLNNMLAFFLVIK